MFNNCVKTVTRVWMKCENAVNVSPQHVGKKVWQLLKTMQNSQFLPDSFDIFSRYFPQPHNATHYLLKDFFSPLSTITITTTTNL